MLRKAQQAGHVRSEIEPDEAAVRLTALMDGLQPQWLFDRDIDMARQVRTAVMELLTSAGVLAFDGAQVPTGG